MKFIYKPLATIYQQYVYRKIPTPYFRTIMTVIGFLFLHVIQLALLFNLPLYFILPGTNSADTATVKYLKGAVYLAVLISLFYILIDKKKVLAINVNELAIKRGRKIIIIYFLVNLAALAVLLIIHGLKMKAFHL